MDLVQQIQKHRSLYAQGKPIISNEEYDNLEQQLKSINPNHPIFNQISIHSDSDDVEHTTPLLSLEKTYDLNILNSFINNNKCIMTEKIDGMSLKITYKYGKLINASTRGDGNCGKNITDQVMKIVEIPKTIQTTSQCIEIRGELYYKLDIFEKYIRSDTINNNRNAVVGVVKSGDSEGLERMSFFAYDILNSSSNYMMMLITLKQWKFDIPQKNIPVDLNKFIISGKRNHPIDGLVFRINDTAKYYSMGSTSHHPKGAIAFKIRGETAITRIDEIIVKTCRTGKISFKAKFYPIKLSGATITYASLFNAKFILDGQYYPGCDVKIVRSGEVIPYIMELVNESDEEYELPTNCPSCNDLLKWVGPNLFCKNSDCNGKLIKKLIHYVDVVNMKGVGKMTIMKMHQHLDVNKPCDLYDLTMDDIRGLPGFAAKSASNVYNTIQNSRKMLLSMFIRSLGIPLIGKTKSKELEEMYGSIDVIRQLKCTDLIKLYDWSYKTANALIDGLKDIDDLLGKVDIYVKRKKVGSMRLDGKVICITGKLSKTRKQFEEIIEDLGGRFVNSMSSKVNYLVIGKKGEGTTKHTYAVNNGIPIITEDDLYEMIKI